MALYDPGEQRMIRWGPRRHGAWQGSHPSAPHSIPWLRPLSGAAPAPVCSGSYCRRLLPGAGPPTCRGWPRAPHVSPSPRSENYVIRWASTGVPQDIELLNNLKAIFTVSEGTRLSPLGLWLGGGAACSLPPCRHSAHASSLPHGTASVPLNAACGVRWGTVHGRCQPHCSPCPPPPSQSQLFPSVLSPCCSFLLFSRHASPVAPGAAPALAAGLCTPPRGLPLAPRARPHRACPGFSRLRGGRRGAAPADGAGFHCASRAELTLRTAQAIDMQMSQEINANEQHQHFQPHHPTPPALAHLRPPLTASTSRVSPCRVPMPCPHAVSLCRVPTPRVPAASSQDLAWLGCLELGCGAAPLDPAPWQSCPPQ